MPEKPLGKKAYGSIPHLPGSRRGPGDHGMSEQQGAIATTKTRDKHDKVFVSEKIDGSCVSVARINGTLHPLIRSGYTAVSSKYLQHRMFHDWAMERCQSFSGILRDGERLCGEWIAQAHGIRYVVPRDWSGPFVAFDIMSGGDRLPYHEFLDRTRGYFRTPVLYSSSYAMTLDAAIMVSRRIVTIGTVDAVAPEGVVYRVERNGKFDFMCKYVRPDYEPGKYLPEISGQEAVWNWQPTTGGTP